MDYPPILNIIFGFILIGTLFFAFYTRVRMGKTKDSDRTMDLAARRNVTFAAVIVMIFLWYWFRLFTSGKLEEEGITGWKVYVLIAALAMGVSSFILLLYARIKKKK